MFLAPLAEVNLHKAATARMTSETAPVSEPVYYYSDVDTRVWLTSTRTYVAFEVPFMVWIHSRLGGCVELIKRQQQEQRVCSSSVFRVSRLPLSQALPGFLITAHHL